MYDKDWAVFQPDIIIHPGIGVMWRLTLQLKHLVPKFVSKTALLRFLQLRFNSRQLQLDLFKKYFQEKAVTLAETAALFDISNDAFKKFHVATASSSSASAAAAAASSGAGEQPQVFTFFENSVLRQENMVTVFTEFFGDPSSGLPERGRFMVSVVIEYIKSLEKMRFS